MALYVHEESLYYIGGICTVTELPQCYSAAPNNLPDISYSSFKPVNCRPQLFSCPPGRLRKIALF